MSGGFYAITNRKRDNPIMGQEKVNEYEQLGKPEKPEVAEDVDLSDVEVGAVNPDEDDDEEEDSEGAVFVYPDEESDV